MKLASVCSDSSARLRPSVGVSRLCVSLLALLATALPVVAAPNLITPKPIAYGADGTWDTTVTEGGTSDSTPFNLSMRSGGAGVGKKSYVKITVPGSKNDWAPPTPEYPVALLLKLSSTHTAIAGNISVYAANNFDETTTFTSANAPRVTTFLDKQSVNVGNNTVLSFDVTSYISGPGTYTFCLTTDVTTRDIQVFSTGAAAEGNKPKLQFDVEVDPGRGLVPKLSEGYDPYAGLLNYFERTMKEVLDAGEIYRDRYLESNLPTDVSNDIDYIGYFDATKPPYGMVAGVNTALVGERNRYALQRCVNEARDAQVAVYIPPGTYYLDEQIQLIQGNMEMTNSDSRTNGERWDAQDFPCVIIGNNDASTRTKLVLQNSAAGFNDTNNPKDFLYYWRRWAAGRKDPKEHQSASLFNASLSHVDIDLGTNTGAIGVSMGGSQGTSLHDVNVTGTTFFAGFHGLPSVGGSTTSISVDKGQYGIWASTADRSGLNHIGYAVAVTAAKFGNQTESAVRWEAVSGMTLVGVDIDYRVNDTNKAPIYIYGTSALQGNLSIIDCRVDRAFAGPMVMGNRNLYATDVFANRADPLGKLTNMSDNTSRTQFAGSAGGWTHIQEWYDGTKGEMYDNGSIVVTDFAPSRWNGGTTATASNAQKRTDLVAADVPADLITRHTPARLPKWSATDVGNVINAKRHGVVGDYTTNDSADLQTLLNGAAYANKAIFLPRGEYSVQETMDVANDRIVFGIDKKYSAIKATPNVIASGTAPLLKAGTGALADKTAPIYLANLTFLTRMTDAHWFLADWQVGRNSVVRNCIFDRRNGGSPAVDLNVPLVWIHGNGGGRWYNLWNDTDANQGANYRHFKIEGTWEPLRVYMMNAESDTDVIVTDIVNSSNIDIYATKWEGVNRANPLLKATNALDLRVFGFGGNGYMSGTNSAIVLDSCDDVVLATQNFQASVDDKITTNNSTWVKDFSASYNRTTPRREQFVMYKTGMYARFRAFASNAGQDGYILQGNAPVSNANLRVGDNGTSEFRAVLSFQTREIPTNAIVRSIKLRLKTAARTVNGTIPNIRAEIFNAPLSSSATLQTSDWNTPASGAMSVTFAAPSSVGGWTEVTFTPASSSLVNLGGETQIRLRYDTADGDSLQDFIEFYAGEAAGSTSPENVPTLDITYDY